MRALARSRGWAAGPGSVRDSTVAFDTVALTLAARDCTAVVDGFAAPGLRRLRARRARTRQENAMGELVRPARGSPGRRQADGAEGRGTPP
ncbi:hypothetical protein ACFV2S_05880 [Streptomyces sp. NPDC059695]|uniref:hypothetical protein n=1 Tax=Streptomyces sp. NPDC059695 TaxID=3346910 RepID=UPI0036BA95B9